MSSDETTGGRTSGASSGVGEDPPGPSTGGTAGADSGTSTAETTAAGPETWGEPIDCEQHAVTGPSSLSLEGFLDGVESALACDFLGAADWVHRCDTPGVGFLALCEADDGSRIRMLINPPIEGMFDAPAGDPRYSIDIEQPEANYIGGGQNAVEHTLTITAFDESERRLAGEFTAAWYDLTLQGLHLPDGSITGSFEILY